MVCSKGDVVPVDIKAIRTGDLVKLTVQPKAETPQVSKKNPRLMCGPYVPVPDHLRPRLAAHVEKLGPTEVARRIGCSAGTIRGFLDGGNTKAPVVKAITQYLNANAGAYQGKPSQDSPALPGVLEVGS